MQNRSPFVKAWYEMRLLILPIIILTIGFNLFASNALPWTREAPEMEQADIDSLLREDVDTTPVIDTVPEVDTGDVDTTGLSPEEEKRRLDSIRKHVADSIAAWKKDSAKNAQATATPKPDIPTGDVSDGVKMVTTAQVKRLLDEKRATFIDARRSDQFEKGHIPGSINIYAYEFADNIPKVINIPRDQLIVVYCDGGMCELSHDLSEELIRGLGFKKVVIYQGGWEEWNKTNNPKATGK